jgi:UDP-N-acetyl-D-mannosaminuronic acid dehydrogenase
MTAKHSFKSVSVIGLGYVGLPTAATVAARGVPVIGVDINEAAVSTINSGSSHILETDLDVILQGVVATGKLKAITRPEPADVFVITVPTPVRADKRADLGAVEAAFRSITPALRKGTLVILESTSPVGTTERMTAMLEGLRPDLTFPLKAPERSDVMVAYCPERILPGHTLRELVDNSRTVGGLDKRSGERAEEFYRIFCMGEIVQTNSRTAELVKLAENAYRDVNLAFANELSMLCADLDIDVHELIEAANRHPRVNVLVPGPGVGGHCIPVDPWFIVEAAPERARIIRTAREVNTAKTGFVLGQIRARAERFKSPRIAFFGLAYKPDVDDLRESPALEVVEAAVKERLGEILVVEPHIDELPMGLKGQKSVRLIDQAAALEACDIVVALVGHRAFRSVKRLALAEKVVIDTVGLWRTAI